jgi:hypothetical protein
MTPRSRKWKREARGVAAHFGAAAGNLRRRFRRMKNTSIRVGRNTKPVKARRRPLRMAWLATGVMLLQAGGCVIDPDVFFRAALSVASDTSVFLLDNLVASL